MLTTTPVAPKVEDVVVVPFTPKVPELIRLDVATEEAVRVEF